MLPQITKLIVFIIYGIVAGRCSFPVIIVPGAGGNQLEGKLIGKESVPAWYCSSTSSDWFRLWLDLPSLLPYRIDCWADNMRVDWNMATLTARNRQGVLTRAPGFGGTSSIEVLDRFGLVKYFKPFVEFLVAKGHTRGKDVRAAPYDYRYSPDTLPDDYYVKLQTLVEETYTINGNKSAIMVSHSFGSPITLNFLANKVTEEWKKKYIKHWVSLSGIYGGAKMEFEVLLSGFLEGLPEVVVDRLKVRTQQRTELVNTFLLPTDAAFNPDQVVVETPKRTYNLKQMDQLFVDAGIPEIVPMHKHILSSKSLLTKPPNVPMSCIYGVSSDSTPNRFIYGENDFPDNSPKVVLGEGDGTVNLESLQLCAVFKGQQQENVTVHEIVGADHNGVIGHNETLEWVNSLIGGK